MVKKRMRYRIIAVVLAGWLLVGSVSSHASDDTTTLAEQPFIELSTTEQGLMRTPREPPELTQNQNQFANQQAKQSARSRRKRWIVALVPLIAVAAVLIWAWASSPST